MLIAKPTENNRCRNTGRTHFKPGNRANPGGRPKGLMQLVRAKTKDGKELVDTMLKIARGKLLIEEIFYDKDSHEHAATKEPSHRDRIAAIEWLADRGFGRCVNTVEISGKDCQPIAVEHMSAEQLRQDMIQRGEMDASGRLTQKP